MHAIRHQSRVNDSFQIGFCNKTWYCFVFQISQSNARTVALRDVKRTLTGFYKCEVSADAPLFHTEIKSGLMIVVGTLPALSTSLFFFNSISFRLHRTVKLSPILILNINKKIAFT